jgi:phenylalanyl-tRNA synthetase alpha chain
VINAESVTKVRDSAIELIRAAGDSSELDSVRVNFLGKKGHFTELLKGLKDLAPEERKEIGAVLNQTKIELELVLEKKKLELSRGSLDSKLEKEKIDVTLPLQSSLINSGLGSLHPVTNAQRELERIFTGLGFTIVDGPEVEHEHYNFDALNIPSTHPARDMQDTLWTNLPGVLLRTHTSSMQVRALEKLKPPLRIVAPGRCFRAERSDSSHDHTFYQMEGMMIDRKVTVGHLIYFMKTLLKEIFGEEKKIRLRPGFFPFVEPGFELDIWFKDRWLELLPCGLIHPKVLEMGGIDPNQWQGFAFGLGLSRLVMSRYQIDDIRHMQSGDLRFLKQFR